MLVTLLFATLGVAPAQTPPGYESPEAVVAAYATITSGETPCHYFGLFPPDRWAKTLYGLQYATAFFVPRAPTAKADLLEIQARHDVAVVNPPADADRATKQAAGEARFAEVKDPQALACDYMAFMYKYAPESQDKPGNFPAVPDASTLQTIDDKTGIVGPDGRAWLFIEVDGRWYLDNVTNP